MFLPNWSYDGADPGLRLFTLANAKLPAAIEANGTMPTIFEIGCADTDFMKRAEAATGGRSCVTGIDWRHGRKDARTAWLPPADVFISLSTIEHIGLGHYEQDPIDPYGDIKVVQRVRESLAMGAIDGWFYFDVPYAPEGYWVKGTKCRIYDDQALRERFGPHEVLGYTTVSVDGWIEKPITNATGPRPYYYVALLVRKGNGSDS